MKKRILGVSLLISMLLSSVAPAYAENNNLSLNDSTQYEIQAAAYSYTKTVIKSYSSSSAAPSSIYYEEYNSNLGSWFYGTLFLHKVEGSGNIWTATFTGTMYQLTR